MIKLEPDVNSEEIRLGELPGSLGFQLRLAQLKAFHLFYRSMSEQDKKAGEFTVLWVIGLNPGARQGAIARALKIKPAHMTKLVQRMVTVGFVARRVPPDDRRSVRLSLTAEGQAFVAQHRARFLAFHAEEAQGLDADEAAQLMALLEKYLAA